MACSLISVTTEKPNKLFTDKEWEVFFYDAAIKSQRNCKTIKYWNENSKQSFKYYLSKAEVHSGCQLRAFGKSKGFDRYIPYNFVSSRRTAFERGA
ncbi:hypothetical protein [Arsenophonus nasoniae]|uniref:Uncharacterized protein n=1 Tax=Arsenophonus nasoniae TaxID=638 RepID=A0A4V1BXU9_9GAMM|nr:hypothetical protein [Arsenophonus nasoniae]QBY46953.1 hypothetical protein ArsFIN_55640 [Arsenophonus nasoniae]